MAEGKTSPGPWISAGLSPGGSGIRIVDGMGFLVALVDAIGEKGRADAALIASAPEMRELLLRIVDAYGPGGPDCPMCPDPPFPCNDSGHHESCAVFQGYALLERLG
jgi:hypothetical protein